MGVYMALLAVQTNANLVWLYPLKTLAVAGGLWWFRKEYPEIRLGFPVWGVAVGLLAIGLWIGLDSFYPKLSEVMNSFEWTLSRWMNSPPPAGKAGAV